MQNEPNFFDVIKSRQTIRHFRPKKPSDRMLLRCLSDAAHSAWSCNLWNVEIREIPEDLKSKVSNKVAACPRAFAIFINKNIKSDREADSQSLGSAIGLFQLAARARGLDSFWMAGISGDKLLRRRFGLDRHHELMCAVGVGWREEAASAFTGGNVSVKSLLGKKDNAYYRRNIRKVYAGRSRTFLLSDEAKQLLLAHLNIKHIRGNLDQDLVSALSHDENGKDLYFFVPPEKLRQCLVIAPNSFSLKGLVTELFLRLGFWTFYDTPYYKVAYPGFKGLSYFAALLSGRAKVRYRDRNLEIVEFD